VTHHYILVTHECDTEHDDGLPECDIRIHYAFYPYQPERGPSYASGGEPAYDASIEFDHAEREIDGKWIAASEFDEWAVRMLDAHEDWALETACDDNDPGEDERA
jgi:hypothetical protein